MSASDRDQAPAGFVPLHLSPPGSFMELTGPLFGKREGAKLVLGFRVQARHCNPADLCHGGMLLTLADMLIGPAAEFEAQTGRYLPTVSLSADFLAPAPLGAWVEGRADPLRTTAGLMFAQCLITADGNPVLRASGVIKLGVPAASVPGQPDIRKLVP
jgi:uncharacterized protein (TIGR00369 family)